jgi:hypothetical protein
LSQDLIAGLVADGVSQSFFGDIAASRVSRLFADELWKSPALIPPPLEAVDHVLHELESSRLLALYPVGDESVSLQTSLL